MLCFWLRQEEPQEECLRRPAFQHRPFILLSVTPEYRSWTTRNEGFLEGNLFIIDESSMMDQFIAAKLLSMIPDGAKVVFVGDPDQLPSVGAGNVLREMIRSKAVQQPD